MAVPDYQTLMLRLLTAVGDGTPRSMDEIVALVGDAVRLSVEDRELRYPDGRKTVFRDRLQWATTFLSKAGLVSRPRRGVVSITGRGRSVLASKPSRIDNRFLSRYPEFVAFLRPPNRVGSKQPAPDQSSPEATPAESLLAAWQTVRAQLAQELLEQVRTSTPGFFEKLVVDVLVAMGYGGSWEDAAKVIGGPGDGGIDGVIKEDRLGLDTIYVQAKHTKAAIGAPTVQAFSGSLDQHHARKGVFITISTFSPPARAYVSRIEKRIVLIDGPQLIQLMIEHGVGVTTTKTYPVQQVDLDYFEEA